MAKGVTLNGFEKKTYEEVRQSLVDGYQDAYGTDISTTVDSLIGQELSIISKMTADLWEVIQNTYSSRTIGGATGAALEDMALMRNIWRRGATKSTVLLNAIINYGDSVTIPTGSKAKQDTTTPYSWETVQDLSLTEDNLSYSKLSIATLIVATWYEVTITDQDGNNEALYRTQATAGDTKESVTDRLVGLISDNSNARAYRDGENLIIRARYEALRFRVTNTNLNKMQYGNSVPASATVVGINKAAAGTIQLIETPVTNWQSVDNLWDAHPGSSTENDTELYGRVLQSFSTAAGATPEAIENRLLRIEGIKEAVVTENTMSGCNDDISTLMPPHSIGVLVDGEIAAHQQEIIDTIGEARPAGIETIGDIVGYYTDQNGTQHPIKFSTPQYYNGYIKITITQQNPDTSMPTNSVEQITSAAIVIADKLQSGADIAAQVFYKAVYAIEGVGFATVEIAKGVAYPAPGDWTSEILKVEPYERIIFSSERIEITIQ